MTRQAVALLIALLAAFWNPSARAGQLASATSESVLISQSMLVQQSGAVSTPLVIPGAGELFVTLTDMDFPTAFSQLQYAITSATGSMTSLVNAGVQTELDLTSAATLYANVFATLGGSAGLYNLTATFIPGGASGAVPLPASGALLAVGCLLALLLGLRRNRPDQAAIVGRIKADSRL